MNFFQNIKHEDEKHNKLFTDYKRVSEQTLFLIMSSKSFLLFQLISQAYNQNSNLPIFKNRENWSVIFR